MAYVLMSVGKYTVITSDLPPRPSACQGEKDILHDKQWKFVICKEELRQNLLFAHFRAS